MAMEEDVVVGPDLDSSRSPLDKKQYRHITLPNGLQAVLIQDNIAMQQDDGWEEDDESEEGESDPPQPGEGPEEESEENEEEIEGGTGLRDAACSVLVGAGSIQDPQDLHGLAHFLEHLLFMGSEKYPSENEYESYVAKHGGTTNAYTEWEYTVYSLSIPKSHLIGALDRWPTFSSNPSFEKMPWIENSTRSSPSFNSKRIPTRPADNNCCVSFVAERPAFASFPGAIYTRCGSSHFPKTLILFKVCVAFMIRTIAPKICDSSFKPVVLWTNYKSMSSRVLVEYGPRLRLPLS